ncbi:SRPBCC domain-containing protein [Paenibacillus arenosi]
MMMSKMLFKAEGNVLTMERTFNAPTELVFKVFSDSEHLKQWFGPRGWSIPVSNLDFRPGGAWHYCMKCEDRNQGDFYGMESWGKSVYKEIVANEKLVYVDYFSDAEGNVSDNMPAVEVTLTFETVDGKTKLTSIGHYATDEALQTVIDMGMEQGITETWDRLEEHLESFQ